MTSFMAWGKRRHEQGWAADPIFGDPSRLADRALLTVISQTEHINARLRMLEDRFDAAMTNATAPRGQGDLEDLRARTERLAVELAGMADLLESEQQTGDTDDTGDTDNTGDTGEAIDLTEPQDRYGQPKTPGWQPRPN